MVYGNDERTAAFLDEQVLLLPRVQRTAKVTLLTRFCLWRLCDRQTVPTVQIGI